MPVFNPLQQALQPDVQAQMVNPQGMMAQALGQPNMVQGALQGPPGYTSGLPPPVNPTSNMASRPASTLPGGGAFAPNSPGYAAAGYGQPAAPQPGPGPTLPGGGAFAPNSPGYFAMGYGSPQARAAAGHLGGTGGADPGVSAGVPSGEFGLDAFSPGFMGGQGASLGFGPTAAFTGGLGGFLGNLISDYRSGIGGGYDFSGMDDPSVDAGISAEAGGFGI